MAGMRDGGQRRGLRRPAALPLRHQGAALRRGADLLHAVSAARGADVTRRAAPATPPPQRLLGLPRPLPAQRRAARDEWLLWQELACSASGSRRPRQGRRRALRGPLRHLVDETSRRRHRAGVFDHADPPPLAETAVALSDGLGARVLADDPDADPRRGARHDRGHRRAPGRPRRPAPRAARRRSRRMTRRRRHAARRGSSRRGRPSAARRGRSTSPAAPTSATTPGPTPRCRIGEGRRSTATSSTSTGPTTSHPQRAQGLPEGVRRQDHRVQLRLDGGHVRQDPAGNQYDIIFPIAKWVVKLRREGKLRADRPRPAHQRRPGLLLRLLLQRPVVRRRSRASRCRSPSTRPASAGAPTRSTSMTGSWNDLWNDRRAGHIFTLDDQDEALAMAALLLGLRRQHRQARRELDEIKKLLISQKKYLRAYSSDDVNNMSERRRLDPPHVERRLPLPPRGRWPRTRRSSTSRRRRRAPRSTPTPTRSPPTPSTPAPRCCSSTTCCGPRTRSRT